jgi:hypothetical protein
MFRTGKREQVKRDREAKLDRGVGKTCAAPPQMRLKERRQRPAYSAGETAEQGQDRDGAACLLPVEAAKRREGRIIEAASHAEAHDGPTYKIDWKAVCGAQHEQPRREQHRADGQHAPPSCLRDCAAYHGRGKSGDHQAERQASNHPWQRPAGVAGDGSRHDGQKIVGRAPREDLREAKSRNDRPLSGY